MGWSCPGAVPGPIPGVPVRPGQARLPGRFHPRDRDPGAAFRLGKAGKGLAEPREKAGMAMGDPRLLHPAGNKSMKKSINQWVKGRGCSEPASSVMGEEEASPPARSRC